MKQTYSVYYLNDNCNKILCFIMLCFPNEGEYDYKKWNKHFFVFLCRTEWKKEKEMLEGENIEL